MPQNKRGFFKEIPIIPPFLKENSYQPKALYCKQLMRDRHHSGVARDNRGTSVSSEPLHPGNIAVPRKIFVQRRRGIAPRGDYFQVLWKASRSYTITNLAFPGQGLENPDQCDRHMLIKCNLQAAFRSAVSNFTASRTCGSGTSNHLATERTLPSADTAEARALVGTRLSRKIG